MTANGWLQIAIFFALIVVCAKPLGTFIANVMEGRKNLAHPCPRPARTADLQALRRALDAEGQPEEQHWTRYAGALLAFSAFSAVLLYAIQRLQIWFPFNPQGSERGQRQSRSRLQHRGQLHDQHQLAELCARDHAELLRADGRADRA